MYGKYRFSKQLRRNDCAPNAVINLMKFFGVKIPYKTSYKKLYDYFKISTYGGTHPVDLHLYLVKRRILNSKLTNVLTNPSLSKIVNNLTRKRAMVVAFHSESGAGGHVCLMVGVNKNGFELINYSTKKTLQTVSFDKFQKEVLDFKKALFYIYERKV